MNITSEELIEEARSRDRASFEGWLPCLFLFGSLHELAAWPEVDADDLYNTQPIYPQKDRRTPLSKRAFVLPILKRQPTFRHMITIGRTAHNDLMIPDTSVSKFHAYLGNRHGDVLLPQSLELCDCASTNGTYVEERRLEARVPTRVERGSNVRFGLVSMQILDAGLVWERLQTARR